MNVSKDDLAKLELINVLLKNGTFTLRGVDATSFVETRIWLGQKIVDAKKPDVNNPVGIKKAKKKKVK